MTGTLVDVTDRLAPGEERTSGLAAAVRATFGDRPRGGPAWFEALRAEGVTSFESRGFPSPSDEAWRFTPVRSVLRVPYEKPRRDALAKPIEARRDSGPGPALSGAGALGAVLVDGIPAVLPAGLAKGLEVTGLGDVLRDAPERLEPHLGRHTALDDGFTAVNTALFDDGLLIVAHREAGPVTLHVAHAASGIDRALATPRLLVVAEPGSELTLIESELEAPDAPRLSAAVAEVIVGENASVEHVRIHGGGRNASSVARVSVRQARDSRYTSRAFTLGGALARLDLRVLFDGEGAEATLDGFYFAGTGDLVDHHTRVEHARPRCSSRQRYKGALDGDGVAVFDGTVVVRHGAMKTEAHQENRNLLLSGDAVVHAKPHLEIDADDVKCSHGATVGRLDPGQLFYLRSRGVEAELARSLLVFAFAREITFGVRDPELQRALDDRIAALLPNGAAAKELA
jgi:Fe-S cluster assembly protein SufD